MVLSTQPEVLNVSTEQWPQATCTKIGEVRPCGISVIRANTHHTDRQTDKHTYHNTSHLFREGGEGRSKNYTINKHGYTIVQLRRVGRCELAIIAWRPLQQQHPSLSSHLDSASQLCITGRLLIHHATFIYHHVTRQKKNEPRDGRETAAGHDC